jgi:hypothetical protein
VRTWRAALAGPLYFGFESVSLPTKISSRWKDADPDIPTNQKLSGSYPSVCLGLRSKGAFVGTVLAAQDLVLTFPCGFIGVSRTRLWPASRWNISVSIPPKFKKVTVGGKTSLLVCCQSVRPTEPQLRQCADRLILDT